MQFEELYKSLSESKKNPNKEEFLRAVEVTGTSAEDALTALTKGCEVLGVSTAGLAFGWAIKIMMANRKE